MEMFILGDPRLLSGGGSAVDTNYNDRPRPDRIAGRFTSASIPGSADAFAAAASFGQKIHGGRTGYHHTPEYNRFLVDGEWPSAGIELETVLRTCSPAFAHEADDAMRSNWFHFERDGSLDREHGGQYGYELITEPLPPHAYRDIRLWTGLQNVTAPWLKSFESPETGLHVHVGLNQFEELDGIPVTGAETRRSVGRMLSSIVYYAIDQAFVDRVALRRTTSYCEMADCPDLTLPAKGIAAGGMTGAELVDYCIASLYRRRPSPSCYATKLETWARGRGDPRTTPEWIGTVKFTMGHCTEINHSHEYTIEFRRAKGTLHALSVHRIVELMTSIVRFAGKLCREPDYRFTRHGFMDWLIETTTSEALRNLAKQTKG